MLNKKEVTVDDKLLEIFEPVLALMIVTMLVWFLLLYRRLSFAMANRISAEKMNTPQKVKDLLPEKAMAPAYNLANLFELPVLFYALCVYLFLAGLVDNTFILMAWCYFGLRLVHSIVHCSYNKVMHRFAAYLFSSLLLWVMLFRVVVVSVY